MRSKLPDTYIIPEELGLPNYRPSRKPLSDDVYEQVVRAFPILCADVVPFHAGTRTIWLAWRQLQPAVGWWCFGGRLLIGEDGVAAAVRHLNHDSGLRINPDRFVFLSMQNYLFHLRQQQPQDTPCQSFCFTFSIDLTDRELVEFARRLDPVEYRAKSLKSFSLADLQAPGVQPVLKDFYGQIFNSVSE